MPRKNIAFFCLSYNILGGVQTNVATLVKELKKTGLYDLYLIDFRKTIFDKLLEPNEYSFLEFNWNGKVLLPDNTIIIMPLANANLTAYTIGKNLKFVFWSLFEQSILALENYRLILKLQQLIPLQDNCFWVTKFLMKLLNYDLHEKSKKFLKLADQKHGLVYMIEDHIKYNEQYFNVSLNKDSIVPICVSCPQTMLKNLTPLKDTINIAWLGRLVDFKITSIIYILKNLEIYCKKNPAIKINFYIIGNGNKRLILEKELENVSTFNWVLCGEQPLSEINNFLLEKIDFLCAHGTAALEGAKLGIPTLVVSGNYKPIDINTKVGWVFEGENFSIGSFRSGNQSGRCFEENLKQLKADNIKIGLQCYDHVCKYFSVRSVAETLLHHIEKTELTAEMLKSVGLEKKLFWQKLINKLKSHGFFKIAPDAKR